VVELKHTVNGIMEVDVGIAQRAAGHGIAAYANRGHGANRVEDLEKEGLVDIGNEVADVQRVGRVRRMSKRTLSHFVGFLIFLGF
jgi:hypothetical protein